MRRLHPTIAVVVALAALLVVALPATAADANPFPGQDGWDRLLARLLGWATPDGVAAPSSSETSPDPEPLTPTDGDGPDTTTVPEEPDTESTPLIDPYG